MFDETMSSNDHDNYIHQFERWMDYFTNVFLYVLLLLFGTLVLYSGRFSSTQKVKPETNTNKYQYQLSMKQYSKCQPEDNDDDNDDVSTIQSNLPTDIDSTLPPPSSSFHSEVSTPSNSSITSKHESITHENLISLNANRTIIHKKFIITIVSVNSSISSILKDIKSTFSNDPLVFAEFITEENLVSTSSASLSSSLSNHNSTDEQLASKFRNYFSRRSINYQEDTENTFEKEVSHKLKSYFKKRNICVLENDENVCNQASGSSTRTSSVSRESSKHQSRRHDLIALARSGEHWCGYKYEKIISNPNSCATVDDKEEFLLNKDLVIAWLKRILAGEVEWKATMKKDDNTFGYPIDFLSR